MHYYLYRLLTFLGGPLIDLYLRKRKKLGKEDPQRFEERKGIASFPRPKGRLIWLHGASVGEAMSVLPLINRLVEKYRDIHVLLTTGTVASARMIEGRLPERAIHQYIPIDRYGTVRRFLKHWQPTLAIWVESEFWPNLLVETAKTGCPMVLVNGRVSNDSFEKWMRYHDLAIKMISSFHIVMAQTPRDLERLKQLGARNAKFIGNLKYDAPALPAEPKAMSRLEPMLMGRPVWMAASTHPGEEEIILEVHKRIAREIPDLLTIIAPRHPSRGEEIKALAKDLEVALRSKQQSIKDSTDIYIADTIGELGVFYRLVGIVFMGGSLVEHGGQNPLEAARLNTALLSGPYTKNFADVYQELEDAGAYLKISSGNELVEKITLLLTQPERQQGLARASQLLVESKRGVLEMVLRELDIFLKVM